MDPIGLRINSSLHSPCLQFIIQLEGTVHEIELIQRKIIDAKLRNGMKL